MSFYAKAAIGTLFLALTIGAMGEVMIWGALSLLHASDLMILSGEAIGGIILLCLSVPVFQRILRNERGRATAPDSEDLIEISTKPARSEGVKPTAFV